MTSRPTDNPDAFTALYVHHKAQLTIGELPEGTLEAVFDLIEVIAPGLDAVIEADGGEAMQKSMASLSLFMSLDAFAAIRAFVDLLQEEDSDGSSK